VVGSLPAPKLWLLPLACGYPLGEVVNAYEGAAVVDRHASVAAEGQDITDPAVFEVSA